MFDKNSPIVKIWIKFIKQGKKTIQDVPPLLNLRDIVSDLLEKNGD